MSSFLRRLQRNAERRSSDYETPTQPTIISPDGSYATLHPTKGWRTISAVRLAAQRKMATLLDHILPVRRKRPRKFYGRVAKVPEGTVTRQQRRAAQRGYVGAVS